MKINLEVTDTFGGEANYSWVNRATHECDEHEAPSRLGMVRMAKKFAGLTGQDCLTEFGSPSHRRVSQLRASFAL